MTISSSVQRQFYQPTACDSNEKLIRLPPTIIMYHNLPRHTYHASMIQTKRRLNIWTVEEHERFLEGLEKFPRGPWKAIAAMVRTKTTRQTMTHAQKYREKIKRISAREGIKTLEKQSSNDSGSTPSTPISLNDVPLEVHNWSREIDILDGGIEWELSSLLQDLEGLPFLDGIL